jgi:hypothetical protein
MGPSVNMKPDMAGGGTAPCVLISSKSPMKYTPFEMSGSTPANTRLRKARPEGAVAPRAATRWQKSSIPALAGAAFFLCVSCLWPAPAVADEVDCGPLDNSDWGGVGPWDYYDRSSWVPTGDAPQTRIKLVENVHFKKQWEFFNARTPSGKVAGEVGYTLKLFPNHPKALWTMSRLERERGPLKSYHSAPHIPQLNMDCYFDRAIRFRPNQSPTWMIYGMHLHASKRLKDARDAYENAEKLGEASAQFHYNFGLLLFDLGDIDAAEAQARQAYAKGYQLRGLKDKLKQRGRDVERTQ